MSKKLVAALLALFMLAGLVACSGKPAEAPKTEEAPKAAEAPKTEEAPKAEEAPKTEEVKITDGVWTCASDATHFALVKFKEDGTFYARGLMGQKGFFGKYEVVDQAVEYYDAHEDGTINGEDVPMDILKSEKAVKFMHEDGSPYEVRKVPETVKINDVPTPLEPLNKDLGAEYCALTGDVIHQAAFDDYPRSLKHDPKAVFTEDDEIRNLLYKFMVAELSEQNKADGWKQQELTLELYHNGYVDMATGDMMVDEKYQSINGNVYTLADGATVTVDPEAYTAVYVNGDKTINFVKFGENAEAGPAVKAQYEGDAFGGRVKLVAKMFEDGTIVIYGNDNPLSKGTYEGQGLPKITLDKGVAEIKATSATDVKLVFTADLGDGKETEYILEKVDVVAEAPAAPAVVARYEGEAFSGAVKLVAEMYDDNTIVICGNDKELTRGTYEGQGLPTISLEKGTAEIKATSATDVKLVYTADLGNGKEDSYELPKVEIVAETPAAAPAVVARYEGEAFGGAVKLFAEMYDDNTIVICANKGGEDVELARGTYEGQGLPTITLDKGTAEIKATSATDVKLVFNADIGTGSAADYILAKVNN